MTLSHVPQLTDALQRRTLALFIGADLAREVTGLPSRADLARDLARRKGLVGQDATLPYSLAEVAQRVGQAGNRWEFTAFIRDALDTAGKSPQPFHRRIVELVEAHQIETIITIAYDNLLESAFQEAGLGINRVARGGDVSFINPERPTLIKLYGDAQQPDTLVVTDRDHSDLLRDRDREPLLDEVRRAFRRNTLLFLGYNLADPDFRFLFDQIAESRFARIAYAVWPGVSAELKVLPEADVRMWRDRGIVILDTDPLGILSETVAQPAPDDRPEPVVPSPVSPSHESGESDADQQRLQRALKMAQRTLAILEEQAAGFGKLHVPAHLRIELEEKRGEVAELEARLGGGPAAPAPGPAPVSSTGPRRATPEGRMPDTYFDIQIRIRGLDPAAQAYPVEALLGDGSHFEGGVFRLDQDRLRTAELDPQEYGVALFEALFAGPVLRAYDRATVYADVKADGCLRVRLWIDNDAAELHALAWERLHHLVQGAALPVATSVETPFSRYIGLEKREPAPITQRSARMLFAVSNPTGLSDYGLASLDVEEEIASLLESLGDLRGAGQLQVTLMPGRTGLPDGLRSELEREGYQICEGPTSTDNIIRALSRDGGYHILHYLGHGAFDRRLQQAALFLECEDGGGDEDGSAEPVKDEKIAALLKSAGPSLHLVFLAACESARRDPEAGNPFVGLAPKLVQVDIPAVVAMQDLISIVTARKFAHDFYSYLLQHGVVDKAMNQARLLLFESGRTDWPTPVLFMRLKEGRLFAVHSDARNQSGA